MCQESIGASWANGVAAKSAGAQDAEGPQARRDANMETCLWRWRFCRWLGSWRLGPARLSLAHVDERLGTWVSTFIVSSLMRMEHDMGLFKAAERLSGLLAVSGTVWEAQVAWR